MTRAWEGPIQEFMTAPQAQALLDRSQYGAPMGEAEIEARIEVAKAMAAQAREKLREWKKRG